jgi:hypothetical protein
VIQQDVHWWIAKENTAQFQSHFKDGTDDIRWPKIDRLLYQQVTNPSARLKVIPRF